MERRGTAQSFVTESLAKLADLNAPCNCFNAEIYIFDWKPSFQLEKACGPSPFDHIALFNELDKALCVHCGCDDSYMKSAFCEETSDKLASLCEGLCLTCVRENKFTSTSGKCTRHRED